MSTKGYCFFIGTSWDEMPVSYHFRALAKELARRGHRVITIVDHQRRDVENHAANPAVFTWPSYRPVRLRDAIFLYSLLRKYPADCVITTFGSTNVMVTTGWLTRVPLRVAWYLTLQEAIDIDRTVSRWWLKFMRFRKRLIYKLATHIVPNSEAGSQDVQSVFGVPASKCHVGYLSLPDPQGNRDWQDIPKLGCRPICVGRLHATKGQDVLIRAVARLKSTLPEMRVEFVGDGPRRNELVELAQQLGVTDHCLFSGRLPHDEVLRRMAASSVTVAPSRSECFGLVNLESLAVGTPVVASDVGGIGEIFHDGVEGFLVAPEDDEALAERIHMVLSDTTLRQTMSARARERFQVFEQCKVVREQADWLEQNVALSRKTKQT